jgi:hypothetical protein
MIDFSKLKYHVKSKRISNTQQTVLNSFLLLLIKGLSSRKIDVIYRGEKLSSFKLRLAAGNKNEVLDRLFFIGDKARHYWERTNEYPLENERILKIDDDSDEIFKYIIGKYKKIFKNKREVITEFKQNNPQFVDFFTKGGGAGTLIARLKSSDTITRLVVRDYLMKPLHHIGNIGLGSSSHIVSTTLDQTVARKFSGNEPDSVTIVAWRSLQAVNTERSKTEEILKKFDIPHYGTSFFWKQKEVSLKGAVLPHYILGLIDHDKGIFHLNPHLFDANQIDAGLLVNGFPIDQGDFDKIIRTTGYRGYIMVINGDKYREKILR